MMYSENELRARDLRASCIHEYGHVAAAMHFDIYATAIIEPNPNGGIEDTKYWSGQCRLYGQPTPYQERMIGLAGIVAEAVDRDPSVCGWQIEEDARNEPWTLSDTDVAMMGDFTEGDIDECLQLVRSLWTRIVNSAELEIRTMD